MSVSPRLLVIARCLLAGDAKGRRQMGCAVSGQCIRYLAPATRKILLASPWKVEALACVTPVLISNQVNIWREIEADRAGLVADDTLAGTQQLFHRWEDLSPEEKKAMTWAAKDSYFNRFGVAGAAKNLLATMEEMIVKKKLSRAEPVIATTRPSAHTD